MANLASAHNLQALSKAALRYAHENVETVLQSQEFLKSPINQVKYHSFSEFLKRNQGRELIILRFHLANG